MIMVSKEKLTKELRRQLEHWWDELIDSYRTTLARPGLKSMKTLNCEDEIKRLTKLVGPTPWQKIQLPFLATGGYQELNAEMGIATEETLVDEPYVRAWAEKEGLPYRERA